MRFTTRDLFWLTTVVAIMAAFCLDRMQLKRTIAHFDELSEIQAQYTAAEMQVLRDKIKDLDEQKRILQHQNTYLSISRPTENPSLAGIATAIPACVRCVFRGTVPVRG
jgi:hypothetical protein